jgi:hypothetical protein
MRFARHAGACVPQLGIAGCIGSPALRVTRIADIRYGIQPPQSPMTHATCAAAADNRATIIEPICRD